MKRLIQLFGFLGVVLGAFGLILIAAGIVRFIQRSQVIEGSPYASEAFYGFSFVSALFDLVLVYVGFLLWRIDDRGLRVANVLFPAELLYWILTPTIQLFLLMSKTERTAQIGHSMASAGGIGDIGLTPQLVTAFPLVGLIVLNLAYRKLKAAHRT